MLKNKYNGIFKSQRINSLSNKEDGWGFGSSYTIMLNNSILRWWQGDWWSTWEISIHGNKIVARVNGNKMEAQDTEYTKGSYGLFTISQPTRFTDMKITTIRALTLQEIISKTSWPGDEVNIIVNFNNKKEDELSNQACVNAFNSKSIHYLQVTTSANASDVNTFLSKIGNRGKYVESSNYNTYMSQLTEYIATYVKSK